MTTKLGVFGGTFDPVHLAHLRCVEEAREALRLDRVVLVPAADPPHKRGRAITAATHRLAMLRAAVRGHRPFAVSTVEIDRAGPSYTIDTLRLLQERNAKARLNLIMGIDAFREIHTWKDYIQLFAVADIAVLSRPPDRIARARSILPVAVRSRFRYSRDRKTLLSRSGNRVFFLSVTALDISATTIRDRVRRGRSIRYLVPAVVERYIEREGLYRAGNTRV